jgi:hypothetical protein
MQLLLLHLQYRSFFRNLEYRNRENTSAKEEKGLNIYCTAEIQANIFKMLKYYFPILYCNNQFPRPNIYIRIMFFTASTD